MKVDINKNKIPTADKLRRLYLVQKLSSPNIARIYGRDPKYVRTLLRKCGVPVRTKSEARKLLFNIHIPKRELKKMYLSKRMSSPEIAKKFKCNPGLIRNRLREYKIPVRSIQEALPLSNRPKYPQHNFSGDLEEKSYLMGFSKGDLHVYARSKNSATIFINVSSTKQELIEIVEESFLPYGHIWKSKPNKDGIIYIHCSLNRTFDFLLGKKDLIESWVLKNKNYFTAFLAGYSDAEGSFCLCGGNGVFSIRSQDKNILHQIRAKLVELGILLRPPQIARRKGTKDIRGTISNKDIWGIWVHRKDSLLKLIDLLSPSLKHTAKQKQMKIVKHNILWRNKTYNRHQASKYDKLYSGEGININYVRSLTRQDNLTS